MWLLEAKFQVPLGPPAMHCIGETCMRIQPRPARKRVSQDQLLKRFSWILPAKQRAPTGKMCA